MKRIYKKNKEILKDDAGFAKTRDKRLLSLSVSHGTYQPLILSSPLPSSAISPIAITDSSTVVGTVVDAQNRPSAIIWFDRGLGPASDNAVLAEFVGSAMCAEDGQGSTIIVGGWTIGSTGNQIATQWTFNLSTAKATAIHATDNGKSSAITSIRGQSVGYYADQACIFIASRGTLLPQPLPLP